MIYRYKTNLAKAIGVQPKKVNSLIKRGEVQRFMVPDMKSKTQPELPVWVHMPSLAANGMKFLESCKKVSDQ